MPNAETNDDEFIALIQAHGPTKAAGILGCNVRKVFERRRRIEKRRGEVIAVPGNPIHNRIKEIGLAEKDWSVAWDKSDGLSVLVHNPDFTPDDYKQTLQDAVAHIKKLAPKFPTVRHSKPKDGHCLVINATDLHFGGWGLGGARNAVLDATTDAISRAAPYPLEKIIFVIGSDCLHTDTGHYTTTKGTPVETDGSTWAQAFKAAQSAYIDCIATLIPIAPVHVVHVSGNHDELMSYALAQVIEATFSKTKGVTFDVTDHPRKYVRFHDNLICFTHGDKVKDNDLPMIVSHEAAQEWGATKFRYVYMGHIHHNKQIKYQSIKEHPGIVLQWLRSPKPTDNWHRDRGFLGQRGMTSFIHSRDGGQVCALNINL